MNERQLIDRDSALMRLHRDLGLKPLTKRFARLEIFLGLLVVSIGLLAISRASFQPLEIESGVIAAGVILTVLGGYLALAGQRSLLYQSNNMLVAYLAELIRRSNDKGPTS
jgi:hypothetical protein